MNQNYVIQKISDEYFSEINSLSVLICGHYCDLPDHQIKRDGIPEYILIYCVGGTGYLVTDGKVRLVQNGDLILLDKNTPHKYGSSSVDPWDILWMHMSGHLTTVCAAFTKLANGHVMHFGRQARLYDLFTNMIQCAREQSDAINILKVDPYGKLILCELMSPEKVRTEDERMFIQNVSDYLIAHQAGHPSLDELSRTFSMSKYHLIRKFKKATGYTPMEFLSRQKIQAACQLLSGTEDTISSISRQLGYTTPYYFSEQFKTITGYAPSMYRKLIQREWY